MKNYYCECGHRGLEEIARTKVGRGLAWKSGIRQTAYFLCEGCNSIYKSTRYGIAESGNLDMQESRLGDFSHFSPYNGELTWEQIMAHASECRGEITINDEYRIESAGKR